MDWTNSDTFKAGCRFYLSYAGSAPTAGNCTTLAGDVEAAWLAHLAVLTTSDWSLTEVDVLDIASETGLSGQWTGSEAALDTGTPLGAQMAINTEFDIARRYRGGKPRMFLPPASVADQLDAGHWSSDLVDSANTEYTNFFTAIEALDIGSMGALAHVNLSYYKGFTNITNSSGRERAVPTYRATALVDTISGYSTKAVIGSQRRRRTATTY